MKVLIETYRGFEISFDTDAEQFYCVSSDFDTQKTKVSYAAAKKYIDDFIKENYVFKPFIVVPNPLDSWKDSPVKIIGIRKDNRFIAENSKGEKIQIGEYDEKGYIIPNPANDAAIDEINKNKEKMNEIYEKIEQLKKSLVIVTLKDVKPKYLQNV